MIGGLSRGTDDGNVEANALGERKVEGAGKTPAVGRERAIVWEGLVEREGNVGDGVGGKGAVGRRASAAASVHSRSGGRGLTRRLVGGDRDRAIRHRGNGVAGRACHGNRRGDCAHQPAERIGRGRPCRAAFACHARFNVEPPIHKSSVFDSMLRYQFKFISRRRDGRDAALETTCFG